MITTTRQYTTKRGANGVQPCHVRQTLTQDAVLHQVRETVELWTDPTPPTPTRRGTAHLGAKQPTE